MAKKKRSVAKQIVRALRGFTRLLKSGKPISSCCCVTKLVRREDGSIKVTRITPPTKGA